MAEDPTPRPTRVFARREALALLGTAGFTVVATTCSSDSPSSAGGNGGRRGSSSSATTSSTGANATTTAPDAIGNYSGFGSTASNKTFLRGVQTTDASGTATFATIYPGWYQGRAVHIHVKVYAGGSAVHTGQLSLVQLATDASGYAGVMTLGVRA